MRKLLAITAMLLLVSASGSASAADKPNIIQTSETKVGEVLFVKLPGNPKEGYKWRLNKERSTGLDLVSVDQIGWLMAPTVKSMFYQQKSVLNVAIRARSSGQALLVFDYYRRYSGYTFSRTSMVRVIIKPTLVSQ